MNILVAIWMALASPGQPDVYEEFYESGQRRIVYIAEGDHVDVIRYYENGRIRERGTFVNTKKHGTWTSYDLNGQVDGEASFANGEKTGTWKFWYTNGQLRSQTVYLDDRAIEHHMWSTEGEELSYR